MSLSRERHPHKHTPAPAATGGSFGVGCAPVRCALGKVCGRGRVSTPQSQMVLEVQVRELRYRRSETGW